ncbi:MAG: penicillin-binding protein activator [Halioglobus sp.]
MSYRPTLTRPTSKSRRIALHCIAIPALIVGCAGAPTPQTKQAAEVSMQPITPVVDAAALRLPQSEHSTVFAAAEAALNRHDWMEAQSQLDKLKQDEIPELSDSQETTFQYTPPTLTPNDLAFRDYLLARSLWERGQGDAALAALRALPRYDISPAITHLALSQQQEILDLQGQYLASAAVASNILSSVPGDQSAVLKREIWRSLQRLNTAQIRAGLAAAENLEWRGWLELALIADPQQRGTNLNSIAALQRWMDENPTHPAANPLPGGLGFFVQQPQPAAAGVNKVALLLPLSGRLAPAAKAVRDGYLASYFAAKQAGDANLEVSIIDTLLHENAAQAYQSAIGDGATLVIGPLGKAAVSELGALVQRPVPVIALNRVDENLPNNQTALIQLSLAPEDEAARIAELAFGQGNRRAMIVRPAGAWGKKVNDALRQRWQELGGKMASTASYSSQESYSGSIQTALNLSDSDERARQVRSMLATNVEFTPRRRHDVDVIFLLSRNGAEARSIKPLLSYYYAGSLPVYAMSSIYSGIPDPRDKDLNGINLVDLPWLLGSSPQLRVAIAAGGTGSDNYTRLNALGADAFLLQQRFSQLQAGPDALIQGNTGLLSMNPLLQIERETAAATFAGGKLEPR